MASLTAFFMNTSDEAVSRFCYTVACCCAALIMFFMDAILLASIFICLLGLILLVMCLLLPDFMNATTLNPPVG